MSVEAKRGALIVVEGMDGSGKSTLSKALTARLDRNFIRQPFPSHDGEVGKLIRRSFSGEIKFDPRVLGYLMVADGLDYEAAISKVLDSGTSVVCDRHTIVSGWTYQTEVYSIDAVLSLQVRSQFQEPDVIFIVDVPPEVALARIQKRGEELNPIYESSDIERVTRLRERYMAYAFMHDNVVLLDGNVSPEALVVAAENALKEMELL